MAGDPALYRSRRPLFTGRARLFTPGYTPRPRLRRITEDGSYRVLETTIHYRVSERNTVIT